MKSMAEFDNDAIKIKPHAIMVEFLFQGHINPFVNLALALASKGCTVTYVQTEFTHHRMSSAKEKPDLPFPGARESGLDIRHTTISDGFPLDFDRDLNFDEFYDSIIREFPDRVAQLVERILESERGRSAPFLVADTMYLWPPQIASKYNLVYVSFWTSPAQRLAIGHHFAMLLENGISWSSDNYIDLIREIPRIKTRDIRDFVKHAPQKDDPFIPEILRQNIIKAHVEVRKADFILCDTVEELESEAISTLNQTLHLQPYAIGPTKFLATNLTQISISSSLTSTVDCTEWLNTKPPGSVVYIAFGSLALSEKHFIHELAHALQSSRVNFLWVLRPDAVITSDEVDILPPGFEDDVNGRGLIVSWCEQCQVLSNPAIGGFLTHCGWSSTLESVWFGVPMICHPFFADQHTNRNMVVYDWLCDEQPISRGKIEEKINKFMCGTELEKLRMEMKKVKKIVQNAMAKNGSSHENLDKFLKDLKQRLKMDHRMRILTNFSKM